MVQGTFSPVEHVLGLVAGYGSGAVAAGQVLAQAVLPCDACLGGVQAWAATAGTGVGSTVLDVLVDGASVYAAAKPTLAATATGAFASGRPSRRALPAGALLSLIVLSVSSTGHAKLAVTVAIERP